MIPKKIFDLLEHKAGHLAIHLANLDTAMRLDMDLLRTVPTSKEATDNVCDTLETMQNTACQLQAIVHTLRWMEKGEKKKPAAEEALTAREVIEDEEIQ